MLGPNINGSFKLSANVGSFGYYFDSPSGAFSNSGSTTGHNKVTNSPVTETRNLGQTFSANSSNSIYQNSGKVYPLSLALNFIIKT